ncbi:MAG: hypothetical protein AAB603_03695 [Patescibacteria group bacterium]
MADGKRTGWQVCADTALDIKMGVREELRKFGHLSTAVIKLLREFAKDDHFMHKMMGDNFRTGRGKGARPKLK